jgi:O-acetyl-ADP-ribose deacetylase (regulator of RNase III)
MITYRTGNLLKLLAAPLPDEGINVLVHGANTLARMKSGIAKQIVETWPEVAKVDEEFYNLNKGISQAILGRFSVHKLDRKGWRGIVNLYQQETTRTSAPELTRHLNYEALYTGLERLEARFNNADLIFGFPKNMGCGLAGGEWSIVESMINHVFEDRNVVIVEWNPNEQYQNP